MAIREIALDSSEPHFTAQVALDGTSWLIEFEWMAAAGSWFFSLYDANGTPAVTGRRLVMNWPLTMRFRARNVPRGELLVHDPAGGGTPGRRELGTRCRLYYVEEGGVDA